MEQIIHRRGYTHIMITQFFACNLHYIFRKENHRVLLECIVTRRDLEKCVTIMQILKDKQEFGRRGVLQRKRKV
jgi:hypothetical protein